MNGLVSAAAVLTDAIASRVFPAASVEVGSSGGVMWQASFGRLAFDEDAAGASPQTVFDLASLTKVIATTTFVMEQLEAGRLRLDERVAASFPEWRGVDREEATVRDLLEHASGLPARLVDAPPDGRRAFEHEICSLGLEYRRRSRAIYSDLGFILLGFIVEDTGGAAIDVQFAEMQRDVSARAAELGRSTPNSRSHGPETWFAPGADLASRAAPTRLDERSRQPRRAEVDDDNAAALQGVAGHAGLFGTAPAVGWWAREILGASRGVPSFDTLASSEVVRRFTRKAATPGSSRALGWDTMLPTSSCGSRMSARAFGHAGFTGTSLWIDPEADVYVVLLTNRVHPTADPASPIQDVRRAFHDAVMEESQTPVRTTPSKQWDAGSE